MTLTRSVPRTTLARAVLHVRVAPNQSSQVSRCFATPVIMKELEPLLLCSVGSRSHMFNGPRGLSDTEAPM